MARILLVEDEDNVGLLYRTELEAEGHEVLSARNGTTALAMVREHEPDLVIMDINLPGTMDGLEAMARIRGIGRSIPVIINTGYSQYRDRFMAWAAEDYIVKSGDTSELKASVDRVLKLRSTE